MLESVEIVQQKFGCSYAMMIIGGRLISLQLGMTIGIYTTVVDGDIMWIFTSTGMLSVVAHRELADDLLVRARSPIHIREMFPDVTVDETPNADYPFRTVISRELYANAIADYSLNISYDNFKNSIEENDFHDRCVDIWAIMLRYGLTWREFE
jgi:hypothetical protein